MYFDPSEFDFTSLTDIVSLDNAPAKPATTKPTPTNVDDATDLFNYSELDNTDDFDDEYTESDPNDDVSDILAGSREQNRADATEYFNALGDDAVLDIEGLTLSKAEIKELYKAKSKVDNDAGYFAEQAQRFDEDNKLINQRAVMQQTVLEQNINILRNRLNNPNLPDHEYASTAKQLQVAESSYIQLTNEVNAVMQKRYEQEQNINGYRIRLADQAMASEFPQWQESKSRIIDYLVNDNQIPASSLEKVYDKGLMQIALKAYMYDQNKKRFAEQAKATTAINARSTTGAKTSTRNSKQEDTAKIKAALSKMGTTRQANVDAFKYLKD